MGYSTDFEGKVTVEPPLNEDEIAYLRDFNGSRRMDRSEGPYYAVPGNDFGQTATQGVRDFNRPPAGQPGLWCQWIATEDGTGIEWDGGEKFYYAEDWMAYIIDHFLKPGAVASVSGETRFDNFTFDHVCNGTIHAEGEDQGDVWQIRVKNNVVTRVNGRVVFEES